MNITAVVVTYNRLELLKRTVSCLRQNAPLTHILVINNSSTDGTPQWLAEQADERLSFITQENVGGAGGFYRGIEEACRRGADWIWCMDDDVFPRPDCLARLMRHTKDPQVGILAPRRLLNGRIFTNDFTGYDFSHPFRSVYRGKLKHRDIQAPTEIAGTAFEGPLIRRSVVEKIGLPNRHLFIFCDDTDYCLRAHLAGFRLLYVPDALMDKHPFFSDDSWAQRTRKKRWKRLYQVRNATYLNHHYGKNWAVRHLRGFICMLGYQVTALLTLPFVKAYEWKDLGKLWRAYTDGLHERLSD